MKRLDYMTASTKCWQMSLRMYFGEHAKEDLAARFHTQLDGGPETP